jgi:heavy metal sensor kinase
MAVRSVRARLTLWYTSLLTITFLILGCISYVLVAYTLYEETDSALKSIAETLARQSKRPMGTPYLPGAEDIFRNLFAFPSVDRYYEWLDPSGNIEGDQGDLQKFPLSPAARENILKGMTTFETISGIESYPVRVLTWPLVEEGRVTNVIRIGMSRKNFYMTMRRFLLIMLSLLPVALALAGGGGWMFAQRALKPVDRMTDAARKIGAQHLRDRLDLTGTGDELDRLASTLNEMLGRLDSAFSEMRQFTADASHELQTPLTILRGEIEVALRSPRSIEEYTTILKSALEEIERISSLVEGLLLLARADAGVLKMDQQTVDLARVVDEVMDRASRLARIKPINLIMGHIEPLETTGDFAHLKRLALNLVDNGIKYTPSAGIVKVSLENKEGSAVISVEDTGPGIPPDEQPQIFQRFYRSPEARSKSQGGSGLGLSIVKSIAEAHCGRIELESIPGRGSIFRVYLPLKS